MPRLQYALLRRQPCLTKAGLTLLVVQVAAPLNKDSLKGPVLIGPGGNPVVKLFIFAPAEYYDLIAQDEATNATQRFCHLDLFTAKAEHLPCHQQGGAGECSSTRFLDHMTCT